MMSTIDALSTILAETPLDSLARLALADAYAEAGNADEAARQRREIKALEIREQLLAAGHDPDRTFTLTTARAAKGHEARKAEQLLSTEILVVVFGDEAITKSGFTTDRQSPILYYRKSSGGRFARSVQKFRVALECV